MTGYVIIHRQLFCYSLLTAKNKINVFICYFRWKRGYLHKTFLLIVSVRHFVNYTKEIKKFPLCTGRLLFLPSWNKNFFSSVVPSLLIMVTPFIGLLLQNVSHLPQFCHFMFRHLLDLDDEVCQPHQSKISPCIIYYLEASWIEFQKLLFYL